MDHRFSRDYHSAPASAVAFPSPRFYLRLAGILWRAGKKAAQEYSAADWVFHSAEVGLALESMGTAIHIEGFEHVRGLQGPCVFVANHMSTLETFFLPCVIQPVRDVTFVVKESLLKYPCLGPVLRSRDPLVVGRENPREDLALVLDGGVRHLRNGRSIIIFPQGTRKNVVLPEEFSSLGVKLARKAKVPILPIALKTDAWGSGSLIKDIGRIKPEKTVRIRFGQAMALSGSGKEEQTRAVEFIKENVDKWQAQDRSGTSPTSETAHP